MKGAKVEIFVIFDSVKLTSVLDIVYNESKLTISSMKILLKLTIKQLLISINPIYFFVYNFIIIKILFKFYFLK